MKPGNLGTQISALQFVTLDGQARSHLEQIVLACEAGIEWVQLRMKHASLEAILRTARQARIICRRNGARLIVNDHPHIALRCKADGVHLGNADMPVPGARALMGAEMLIGGTANTPEEALGKCLQGADYIGTGPYRFTRSKQNLAPILGVAGIAGIADTLQAAGLHTPLIAIGGIMPGDLPPLMGIPVHGVAVSGAIAASPHPAETIREFTEILENLKKGNPHADYRR